MGHQHIQKYTKKKCAFWVKGQCRKSDNCHFLHTWPKRTPMCNNFKKYGICRELYCAFSHKLNDTKLCYMYKLGFCCYGKECIYKHINETVPPIASHVETAKPTNMRNEVLVRFQNYPGIITYTEVRSFVRQKKY